MTCTLVCNLSCLLASLLAYLLISFFSAHLLESLLISVPWVGASEAVRTEAQRGSKRTLMGDNSCHDTTNRMYAFTDTIALAFFSLSLRLLSC